MCSSRVLATSNIVTLWALALKLVWLKTKHWHIQQMKVYQVSNNLTPKSSRNQPKQKSANQDFRVIKPAISRCYFISSTKLWELKYVGGHLVLKKCFSIFQKHLPLRLFPTLNACTSVRVPKSNPFLIHFSSFFPTIIIFFKNRALRQKISL